MNERFTGLVLKNHHYFRVQIQLLLRSTRNIFLNSPTYALQELHDSVDEEAEKELLTLFYRVHELEADKLSLQGERMLDTYELHRSEQLLKRYQEQQKISDCIITKQRQLIEGTIIIVSVRTIFHINQF